MENPEWRKLLDKTETEMNSDLNKEELYQLKEELFYVIDERQHQADLTEIGRTHAAARTIPTPSCCPTWRPSSSTSRSDTD